MMWVYGIVALVVVSLIGAGVWIVKDHLSEYDRLVAAETTLKEEKKAALDANKGLADELEQTRVENAATIARLSERAETERKNGVALRAALGRLQNVPGRNEAMPPVLSSAYDIVRERRRDAALAPAGPAGNLPNPRAAPALPASP